MSGLCSWLVGCPSDPPGEATEADTGADTETTGTTPSGSGGGSATDPSVDGTGTETSEALDTSDTQTSGSGGRCGDGVVDGDEQCDDGGESARCDVDCTPAECGDRVINSAAGEVCEGADLMGATCRSEGFVGGTLACSDSCTYSTVDCYDEPLVPTLMLGLSPVKQFEFSWPETTGAEYYQLLERVAVGEPLVPLGGDIVELSLSLTMPLHLRYGASYVLRACNAVGCTDSAEVDVMGSLAEAVGYFKASNTSQADQFGAVLDLSGDGNTLAVGATVEASNAVGIDGDQTDNSAPNAGAVYVFTREPLGSWSQQAYVKASNTDAGDRFGWAVALSDDGDTLVVSAWDEDSNATGIDGQQADDSADTSGAAYVFVRDAMGQWSQQAYLKASNTDAGDRFGQTVALSGDGDTLAVGAIEEDGSATGINGNQVSDSSFGSGAVYVFVRDAMGQWSQQAYVKASNTAANDSFGRSVALCETGDTLAVGANEEESSATGIGGDQVDDSAPDSGAAYVFVRDASGQWSQQAYVKASNTGIDDEFGTSLSLSDDCDTLAVSTYHEDSNATGIDGDQANDAATGSGAAYVFVRDATDQWSQQAYVKASNAEMGDAFGHSVSLSGDGNILAVSAIGEDSNAIGVGGDQVNDASVAAGAGYVFARDGAGQWSQRAYLKAPNPDSSDYFGVAIVLSDDGDTLAISANGEASNVAGIGGDQANNATPFAGAVYCY